MSQNNLTYYNFSDAETKRDFIICGVKLKPFCLGHIILLEALASPLIQPDAESVDITGGLAHFFFALLLCSMSYENGVKLLNDPALLEEITKEFMDNLKLQMEAEANWNYLEKIKLFEDYMRWHLDMPFYTEQRGGNDVPSGVDFKTSLVVSFRKLGFAESEILNMSLKKLYYVWTAYAESEGAIKVWNTAEVKQYEAMKGNHASK